MRVRAIAAIAALAVSIANAQIADTARLNQHRVTSRSSPAPEPGAEKEEIPSLINGLHSADEWRAVRRPELLKLWTTVLGKLAPNEQDKKWFGDIRQAVIQETADRGTNTRISLDLPIERDFLQHHLLLLPKGAGPFPAVICWTSTTPDRKSTRLNSSHGYISYAVF